MQKLDQSEAAFQSSILIQSSILPEEALGVLKK
jgi:hypothetical protein